MNTDVSAAAAAETPGTLFGIAETPIEFFGNVGGAELFIKRDDLIPMALGGNKVRIAAEVFAEMERRGCDAVITYGSVTSNLNRAVAVMARKKGIKCYAIVKQEASAAGVQQEMQCGAAAPKMANACSGRLPLNYRLVLASGAEVVETDGTHVRETVARVISESRARGEKPFYIYGDETGCGNEEVLSRAYRKVYAEILKQEQQLFDGEYHFTEIFLAVGTGSTINGLISAMGGSAAEDRSASPAAARIDTDHHITGISIARTKDTVLLATGPEDERFAITDEYLAGGYGPAAGGTVARAAANSLEDFCRQTAIAHAMPLDPVYTGKALFGTMEEIRKRGITGKVLFIHTGGTPLYYDLLEKEENS